MRIVRFREGIAVYEWVYLVEERSLYLLPIVEVEELDLFWIWIFGYFILALVILLAL